MQEFTHTQMPKWYQFRAGRVFYIACLALIIITLLGSAELSAESLQAVAGLS